MKRYDVTYMGYLEYIHMYWWHSSIFMNNLRGIMGGATFCEQCWTMGCEKRLEFKQDRRSPCHYHTLGQINSCQWDITRGILAVEKYSATVNIQTQMAPNIKFKWSKIPSDRYLQLPNGKIATSPKIYLQISSCSWWNLETDLTKVLMIWKYMYYFLLGTGHWVVDCWQRHDISKFTPRLEGAEAK